MQIFENERDSRHINQTARGKKTRKSTEWQGPEGCSEKKKKKNKKVKKQK